MADNINQPRIYDTKPVILIMEPGCYQWCSCGYSENQPFCDGHHVRYGMMPVPLDIGEPRRVAFCNCKHTKTPPYCDGSHNQLPS